MRSAVTPRHVLTLGIEDPRYYDTESLARAIASHAFSTWDSEAIEIAYRVIRAAENLCMSVSVYLTGGPEPGPADYGPPRALPDGRVTVYSTRAVPDAAQRTVAGKCLIGAIADPEPFWTHCRRAGLSLMQMRMLADCCAIPDLTDARRIAGLKDLSRLYGLKIDDLLTLRLWW